MTFCSYDVMVSCWQFNPKDRPTFTDLCSRLKSLHTALTEVDKVEPTCACREVGVVRVFGSYFKKNFQPKPTARRFIKRPPKEGVVAASSLSERRPEQRYTAISQNLEQDSNYDEITDEQGRFDQYQTLEGRDGEEASSYLPMIPRRANRPPSDGYLVAISQEQPTESRF